MSDFKAKKKYTGFVLSMNTLHKIVIVIASNKNKRLGVIWKEDLICATWLF